MSYVPLVAPSTSLERLKFLSTIADSFIYVVSKVSLSAPKVLTCSRWPSLDHRPARR